MSTAYDPKSEGIYCGTCMQPIEGCNGRFCDWMHVHDRREFCAGSTSLARPETENQRRHRFNMKRHGTSPYLSEIASLSSVA
jgi:hypothetical protein